MKIKDLFEETTWTESSVLEWIEKHHDVGYGEKLPKIGDISIDNGKVNVAWHVHLFLNGEEIPFKLAPIRGYSFSVYDPKTLKGCPDFVGKNFMIVSKDEISFEGAPSRVGSDITSKSVLNLDLPSLKSIHKHIKKVEGTGIIHISAQVKRNILGLLLIDGVTKINAVLTAHDDVNERVTEELEKAVKILNANIGQGQKGVIKAQRELIESDLDDFAEL